MRRVKAWVETFGVSGKGQGSAFVGRGLGSWLAHLGEVKLHTHQKLKSHIGELAGVCALVISSCKLTDSWPLSVTFESHLHKDKDVGTGSDISKKLRQIVALDFFLSFFYLLQVCCSIQTWSKYITGFIYFQRAFLHSYMIKFFLETLFLYLLLFWHEMRAALELWHWSVYERVLRPILA